MPAAIHHIHGGSSWLSPSGSLLICFGKKVLLSKSDAATDEMQEPTRRPII